MKEYLCDNTVIHTDVYYILQKGKRVYFDEDPKLQSDHALFHFEAFLQPPLLLLPKAWDRYQYSIADIVSSYDKMDASFVWQISLLLLSAVYETEASSTGVKSTFQSLFTFLFISRKTMLDTLLQFVSPAVKTDVSVLCRERVDHRPLLPKVSVFADEFYALKKLVPARHPSFQWTVVYPRAHAFKDILLVPVEYDEKLNLLYMCRIIARSVFDSWPVTRKACVVSLPVHVHVGLEQYVMVDEACFFCMENGPKRKATTSTSKMQKRTKAIQIK
jgi:hypothetical protein